MGIGQITRSRLRNIACMLSIVAVVIVSVGVVFHFGFVSALVRMWYNIALFKGRVYESLD